MFLNAWEGKTGKVFWDYIKDQSETIDVFCFMEAGNEFRLKCKELLLNYTCVSADKVIVAENGRYQATYVKKENTIIKSGALLGEDQLVGLGLFTQVQGKNEVINIASIHGIALPGEKLDNPKRLEQSKIIIDYMAKIEGSKLIGGDFNLDINTKSVAMFEENGYRNLIKEYKIDTTRNRFAWDPYPTKQLWADYLFVSPEVKVKSFEVPKNEVSDHLPLIIGI